MLKRLRGAARDPVVRRAVALVVGMRVALGVAVAAIDARWPPGPPVGAHLEQLTPRDTPLWRLFGPWERWDALWWMHVARDGYSPGTGDAAFPPLFPATLRLLAPLMGGEPALAALLVNTVCLVGALVLVHRAIALDLGDTVARRATLVMAVGPGALFLYAPYSEAVFLLLSAGAYLAARRGRFPAAGGLATLAVLCRLQGLTLVVPLAIEAYRTRSAAGHRAGATPHAGGGAGGPGRTAMSRGAGARVDARTPHRWSAVLPPLCAAAAWAIATRVWLGMEHGPLSAEKLWDHHLAWPWQSVGDSVRLVIGWSNPVELCNLVAVLGGLALLPFMARRLPPAATGYATAMVLLTVCSEVGNTQILSAMRILWVVFPLFAAAAMLRVPRSMRVAAVAGGAGLLGLLLWNYVEFHFVG